MGESAQQKSIVPYELPAIYSFDSQGNSTDKVKHQQRMVGRKEQLSTISQDEDFYKNSLAKLG